MVRPGRASLFRQCIQFLPLLLPTPMTLAMEARLMRRDLSNEGSTSSRSSEVRKNVASLRVHAASNIWWQYPNVARVLVLTVAARTGKESRAKKLLHQLDGVNLTEVHGVDYRDYNTEEEEMEQTHLNMSMTSRAEWLRNPEYNNNHIWPNHTSNGALACALGHHMMWQLASVDDQKKGGKHHRHHRRWTIILEDDAWPKDKYQPIISTLNKVLERVPPEADIVHLDDRHCYHASGLVAKDNGILIPGWSDGRRVGSLAYAITTKGAELLLSQPFQQNADFWLDVPVSKNETNMFCPDGLPYFGHNEDKQNSIIHLFDKNNTGAELWTN